LTASKLSFLPKQRQVSRTSLQQILKRRGGASTAIDLDLDDEDEQYDESEGEDEVFEDEYDMSEEEEEDLKLAQSAVRATVKQVAKEATATKKAVSSKLLAKKPKKASLMKRYVPYIVRACMSPATLLTMVKAYWASLLNLDYLKADSSQDLRSALEEKAKKSGSAGGGRKGKRAMKPGQAKTLSDLPQLST
jgi:hypothetical protein